jgi:hypothetical protein
MERKRGASKHVEIYEKNIRAGYRKTMNWVSLHPEMCFIFSPLQECKRCSS